MNDSGAPPGESLHQKLAGCLKRPWTFLAVIPAAPRTSATQVASALADLSNLVRGPQTKLFSTEGLELSGISKVIVDATTHVTDGGVAVVVTDPVLEHQAGIPVTLAADAALLVVHLGITGIEDARRTVELVGPGRIIGVVTVEPPPR